VIVRYTGDNAMGTGNQQGRPDEALSHYVAGFVDGEGSFHVAVQKNPSTRWKWQVIPEFHVSQNDGNQHVLELIRQVLGCGYLKPNHRNSRDRTYVLVVRDRTELATKVVPFFRRYGLRTTKRADFEQFARVVEMMEARGHLSLEGLRSILQIAFSMNQAGARRRLSLSDTLGSLEPSETVRRTLTDGEVKI
jgi:LAGLIDADG endonuclease